MGVQEAHQCLHIKVSKWSVSQMRTRHFLCTKLRERTVDYSDANYFSVERLYKRL